MYDRKGGKYQYERITKDSMGAIRDVLTNNGFHREVNGVKVDLPDTMAAKYANSVNSVIYFAMLPYGLNDQAVNKRYLGTAAVKGKPYHKVEVTFEQEGGGTDFEDRFVYWCISRSIPLIIWRTVIMSMGEVHVFERLIMPVR